MKVGGSELTYCTNVHPGETWDEIRAALETHTLAIKREVAPNRPFGVGLRLSALAAETLSQPPVLEEFRDFLGRHGLYVFTLNGFPYGRFHGAPVKTEVYRPDWADAARAAYQRRLNLLLASLLPPGVSGSISTLPGAFRPARDDAGAVRSITAQLTRQVVHLHELRERTGATIALALEPEPRCLLETTQEAISFFESHLLSIDSRRAVAAALGAPLPLAEDCIRRHIGLCFDTCHAAVEFEDAQDSLGQLARAGVQVAKVQVSSGLSLRPGVPGALAALRAYDEPVYLHQVVARSPTGELRRLLDLPVAFEDPLAIQAEEWRVHFHVPVHERELGLFSSTQDFVEEVLMLQRRRPFATHFEVETYTWHVLPPERRARDLSGAISGELRWTEERLAP